MSTKSTICSGDDFHLFEEVTLGNAPMTHVHLRVEHAGMFAVEKGIPGYDTNVTVAIPATAMDEIALTWIRKRKLL